MASEKKKKFFIEFPKVTSFMSTLSEEINEDMRHQMTDQEIKDEVRFVAEHLEELKDKQQAERQAYFDNPANHELSRSATVLNSSHNNL